ncbi:MAG: hypothetical protein ACOC5L_00595 [Halobacteriota archaeon]
MYWVLYFSMLTMFLCVFGYALKPFKRFGLDSDDLGAIILFYSMIMVGLLVFALGHFLNTDITHLSVFTVIAIFIPALYLNLYTMNTSKIGLDLNRIRDVLLYGAIIWLVGEKFSIIYNLELLLIAGLATLPLVIILGYVTFRVRKLNTEFFMDVPQLLNSSFLILFFIGESFLGMGYTKGVSILAISLAIVLILNLLSNLYTHSKPYLA